MWITNRSGLILGVSIFLAVCTATRALGQLSITFTEDGVITDGDSYVFVSVVDTPPSHTTLTVEGGEVTFALAAWDASRVHIYGGTLASVDAYDTSTIAVYGGEVGHLDFSTQTRSIITGGRIERVNAYSAFSGRIDFYDGVIEERLLLGHQGFMDMYGGEVGTFVEAAEHSHLNLWGGTISGYLSARDESQLRIGGYGFEYDPQGGSLGYGLLTGWWLDGTPFSLSLAPNTYPHIQFVPEPSGMVLSWVGWLLAGSAGRPRRAHAIPHLGKGRSR